VHHRDSLVPSDYQARRRGTSSLTRCSRRDHNHRQVKRSFGRAVISLVLVPYLALSALAPEHVHEADADHPDSAAHRHLQPHSPASHDSDHAQLADDDDHVVWLDGVVLYQSTYQFVAPAAPPTARFELVPPTADWASPPDYDTAPPHGPPRACLSLRAPPRLSA
jgi:hypothetical protein